MSRTWTSNAGENLLASWMLYPLRSREEWPTLSLLAGLSVSEALENLCGIITCLKWPNDIMHQHGKLAGVLLESVFSSKPVVIAGIGVNVNQQDYEGDFQVTPVSVAGITGKKWAVNEVLDAISSSLEYRYREWSEHGPDTALTAWKLRSNMINASIRLTSGEGDADVVAKDIAADGSLLVEYPDGSMRAVYAADISLRIWPHGR